MVAGALSDKAIRLAGPAISSGQNPALTIALIADSIGVQTICRERTYSFIELTGICSTVGI